MISELLEAFKNDILKDVKSIIQLISYEDVPESPEARTNRFDLLLPFILEKHKGNIMEIGAGVGHSTRVFLKWSEQYQRQTLVIDPWETLAGQPHGYGVYSQAEFMHNVRGFEDYLIICQEPSTGKVGSFLRYSQPFAFAFVDGLQHEADVIHDLYLCADHDTQVIAVDDYNRETPNSQVPKAVTKFIDQNPQYELIETRKNIECYLIKK